jgi:hypothetical protein
MHLNRLFLGLTLLIFGGLSAQVQLRLNAGINSFELPDLDPGAAISKQEIRTGGQFNVSVAIGNRFYIEPGLGLLYLQSRLDVQGPGAMEMLTREEVEMWYLQVPLLFGYSVMGSQRDPINLRFFAGPSLSGLVAFSRSPGTSGLEKSDFAGLFWAANAGLGTNLGIFTVDFIYVYGLTNFLDGHGVSSKSTAFHINLGLRL